ncbi:MAG: GTPase HflX [Armatimonadetes bacterium]|nr:GTPase HflX [Armatimonadota bacterium]
MSAISKVHGLTRSIVAAQRAAREALGAHHVPADRVVNTDLLEHLAALAHQCGREVGVLVDRVGAVREVIVGRRWQVWLDSVPPRSTAHSLSGLRLLEVHPQAGGHPTEADRRFLVDAGLDLLVTCGTDHGRPTEVWVATLNAHRRRLTVVEEGPLTAETAAHLDLNSRVRAVEDALRQSVLPARRPRAERAVLAALRHPEASDEEIGASLEELRRLAETAGASVAGVVVQRRAKREPATFLGRGKVAEVLRLCEAREAQMVIIDQELTPVQQRNLEQELGLKVVDRTALILDIFARRAQSREGRLQVELAQTSYALPRLAGRGVWLSRLGGGIGTRGPGDTKLEVDSRRLRQRITDLRQEIEALSRHRRLQRAARREAALPAVALVGYTNAGKSTLLNALSEGGAFVEDKLFATLDPLVRKVTLPNHQPVLVVDTVGFIQKLPTQLVAAFKATLEEVAEADLLVHVVDLSHPRWREQVATVQSVLADLGAGDKPVVYALNKTDRTSRERVREALEALPGAVPVSALQGVGLLNLLRRISQVVPGRPVRRRWSIPYERARLLALIHDKGRVLVEEYGEAQITVEAEVPASVADWLEAVLAGRRPA